MPEMRFTKDHEWVRQDGDTVVIGITDHAQNALGDVVFVDLPEVGREVAEGEACAVVESVKAASDVYAPLDGTVTEVNTAAVEDPTTVGSDPQGAGWLYRMRLDDPAAFESRRDELAGLDAKLIVEREPGPLSGRLGRPSVTVCDRFLDVALRGEWLDPDEVVKMVRWLEIRCEECPQSGVDMAPHAGGDWS